MLTLRSIEVMVRRLLAEAIGTFILVFVGTGSIMINDESGGQLTNLGVGLSFGAGLSTPLQGISGRAEDRLGACFE